MKTKDKEPIELKLGDTKTLSVPKHIEDFTNLSASCPEEATITLSSEAPDFVKLSTVKNELDD